MKTQQSKQGIVKAMREIRESFSLEIMNMTLAEQKEFIREQIDKIKAKRQRKATAV